jgi:hypothetical protein
MENNNPDYDSNGGQDEVNNNIDIEDVVNDIDINIVNDINIDNELTLNDIENRNNNNNNNNSNTMSNTNNSDDNTLNNNIDNIDNNDNNEEAQSNSQNDRDDIFVNRSVEMLNIIQNMLDNDSAPTNNNNIPQVNPFNDLINNLNRELMGNRNLMNRINNSSNPSNPSISSLFDVVNSVVNDMNIDNSQMDESNNEQNNPEEEKSEENIVENNIPMLESDYMEYIQTGNLGRQIRNNHYVRTRNRVSRILDESNDPEEDDISIEENENNANNANNANTYDEDFQYALQLQQQEYMLSSRAQVTSSVSSRQNPIIRRLRRVNSTSTGASNTTDQLESRNGRIRINRRPPIQITIPSPINVNSSLSSSSIPNPPRAPRAPRASSATDQLFGLLGNDILQESSMRNFRNIISGIMNGSERAMEDIPVVLEEKQLNNLKKIKYDDECRERGVHTKCTICLGPYENNEILTILPCDHGFHTECINIWLNQHSYKCPICRNETGKGKPHFHNNNNNNGNLL